jgi:glycosyltransferase involved in cell wall biosynthesis
VRVVRVYHAGRDARHRARDRALAAAGVDVTFVVPRTWNGNGHDSMTAEPFRVVELDATRAGDLNRHRYRDERALAKLIAEVDPDVLDIHEEPYSAVAHQVLGLVRPDLPVVMYTAQNVDKRYPPPFHQWEQRAFRRVSGLYPCTAQAASVARGKGFAGRIEVLPLGIDEALFRPGEQSATDDEFVLALVGRLVPEKGVTDAVHVLESLAGERRARLVICGEGPVAETARALANSLGVGHLVELLGDCDGEELAGVYRGAHVVLVPSRATATWTEQFGRVIVEAQASGAVVVGYDEGSIREVGGEPALLALSGHNGQLGRLVTGLARDPEDFERRRQAGIELAADRSWRRIGQLQATLYENAAAAPHERLTLDSSPRRRRAAARIEFGPTAETQNGSRPFALPVLREAGFVARALGRASDVLAETVAALSVQRRELVRVFTVW